MRSVKEGWLERDFWEEDVNWMESENNLGQHFLKWFQATLATQNGIIGVM